MVRQIKPNVYAVGAIDWDRRLFDELIPLPEGTSYNSYLIKGSEKTALLDTVDPAKAHVLLNNLKEAGVKQIDYIIAHHGEQDHSGAIIDVLVHYPTAMVVTNAKCKAILTDLLHVDEDKFITVEDGQSISLGDKTLQFIFIPWVHWPETMGTYLVEDRILFPCDFFGSHLATSSLFVEDEPFVYQCAKRYYAEIMMPFRTPIKNNLKKLEPLKIEMLAPSHGPVYQRPEFIIEAYKDWVGDDVKNEVVLAYVSMHDSVRKMAEHFVDALVRQGIKVRQFNLTGVDIGEMAMALVDAATVVIGAPTFLAGVHPSAAYAAMLTGALRPKTRFVSIIGSFSWAERATEQLKNLLSGLKVEIIEPAIAKGLPRDNDYKSLDTLAEKIAQKHREIGILK